MTIQYKEMPKKPFQNQIRIKYILKDILYSIELALF